MAERASLNRLINQHRSTNRIPDLNGYTDPVKVERGIYEGELSIIMYKELSLISEQRYGAEPAIASFDDLSLPDEISTWYLSRVLPPVTSELHGMIRASAQSGIAKASDDLKSALVPFVLDFIHKQGDTISTNDLDTIIHTFLSFPTVAGVSDMESLAITIAQSFYDKNKRYPSGAEYLQLAYKGNTVIGNLSNSLLANFNHFRPRLFRNKPFDRSIYFPLQGNGSKQKVIVNPKFRNDMKTHDRLAQGTVMGCPFRVRATEISDIPETEAKHGQPIIEDQSYLDLAWEMYVRGIQEKLIASTR